MYKFNNFNKIISKFSKRVAYENQELEFGFDLIFSAYTMHHLKNSDIIMSKLWGKLNPNGVMMVRSPDDIQLSNKLSEIIKDQRSRFESSSEVFSISGAVLAIGYKN